MKEIQEFKTVMGVMQRVRFIYTVLSGLRLSRTRMQSLGELTNKDSWKEREQVDSLSRNLYDLQLSTKILLPDPNLVSGEITEIEPRAVFGTANVDIYRGRYLRRETVAIKVVRAVEGDEHTMRVSHVTAF